jgi:t-SNARE complex subunit (syntaxin)
MNPSDDFQRKIDSLLTVQAQHDGQIQALIRVAELQQSNLERLDDSISDITSALSQERSERVERQKEMVGRQDEMAERQKYLDDRIDRLVSAIGELARRQ